jgi:hypothetical protein
MISSGLFTGVCNLIANVSEQTGCSETLALKLQTPMNHPEESTKFFETRRNFEIQNIVSFRNRMPRRIYRPPFVTKCPQVRKYKHIFHLCPMSLFSRLRCILYHSHFARFPLHHVNPGRCSGP